MKDIVEAYGEIIIQMSAIVIGLGLLALCCVTYKYTIMQVLDSVFYR